MLLSIRNVKSIIKMRWFAILIAAVCVIFLFKQRWPKDKRSRVNVLAIPNTARANVTLEIQRLFRRKKL